MIPTLPDVVKSATSDYYPIHNNGNNINSSNNNPTLFMNMSEETSGPMTWRNFGTSMKSPIKVSCSGNHSFP